MKTTTTNFNNLINNGFPYHYVNLYLNNIKLDVTFKSFNYYGLINSGEGITIGSTCASYVEFELYNQSTSLENEEVQVKVGIDVNGTIENVSLGFFTITKPTNKDEVSKYVAYDRMIKLEKLYVSSLSNPTVKRIMNEIGTQTGYGFKDTLTNDINIDALKIKGYTYREIIGYLSALYGANCVINDIGQIEFKIYQNSNIAVERNKIYENGLELSSDNIFKIEYLKCATGETVEHTSTDEEGEEVINTEDVILSVGAGTTGITISNPLMTQSILENIYNTYLKNLTYRPCKVSMLGNITIECGDIVSVNDGTNIYNVPIMNLKHSIDGGITTNIEAVSQTESEQEINYTGPTIKYVERVYSELIEANEILASKIQASNITTDYLETHYAKIDLANIKDACITTAMIGTEVVGTSQIANSSITDAKIVELTANKITAGELSCDRLIINGSDKSLVYYLNNMGDLTSTQVDTLNGDTLTPRSITADKIVANAITSKEIASNTITANEIKTATITADQIAGNTITSAEIKTGSIKAVSLDVSDLFAQNITFKGTITGGNASGGGVIKSYNYLANSNGMKINLYDGTIDSKNFKVSEEGIINATDAVLKGSVYAEYGEIAGWTIKNDKIAGGTGAEGSEVAMMQSPSSNTTYVFACGGSTHEGYSSCPFRVTKTGNVYSNKFVLSNKYTETSGLYSYWSDGLQHPIVQVAGSGAITFGYSDEGSVSRNTIIRGETIYFACGGASGNTAGKRIIEFDYDNSDNAGFRPTANNTTYLGSTNYKWKEIHGVTIYENGSSLSSLYASSSHSHSGYASSSHTHSNYVKTDGSTTLTSVVNMGTDIESVDGLRYYINGKATGRFNILRWKDGKAYSSIRYKNNIKYKDCEYWHDEIMKMKPCTFYYNDDDSNKRIGLIAEELFELIPELVGLDDEGKPEGIEYSNLTIPLILETQRLNSIIENQQKEINELKDLVNKLINM